MSLEPALVACLPPARLAPGESRVLVYVGANVGHSAELILAGSAYSRVFLFEPVPESAARLRARFASFPHVEVVEAACVGPGEATGVPGGGRVLNVYGSCDGCSSFGSVAPDAVNEWPDNDWELSRSLTVPVVDLGLFLISRGVQAVDTLVIDAQGTDVSVVASVFPFFAAGKVRVLQLELDGPGFRHYDGLPSNRAADLQALFDSLPPSVQYVCHKSAPPEHGDAVYSLSGSACLFV